MSRVASVAPYVARRDNMGKKQKKTTKRTWTAPTATAAMQTMVQALQLQDRQGKPRCVQFQRETMGYVGLPKPSPQNGLKVSCCPTTIDDVNTGLP